MEDTKEKEKRGYLVKEGREVRRRPDTETPSLSVELGRAERLCGRPL
jgi:hypothetical protein